MPYAGCYSIEQAFIGFSEFQLQYDWPGHLASAWHIRCKSSPPYGGVGKIQILIAEDDPDVRSLVLDVVTDLGHAPSCATNGAEALDLYNSRGADVVVSDWMMPRMNGVELCRCVRSRLGAPYTYFILLTALGDAEHRLAGMHAGADDYLPKPFDLADIEARLIAAERVTVMHRRREALLQQARRFAAETDPGRILSDLLHQAIDLVGGTVGMVTRWDDESKILVASGGSSAGFENAPLRLGEGASGRAAEQRAPVLLSRPKTGRADPVLTRAHLESAIAVPLLHDERLVGTLAIGDSSADRQFGNDDAELLEILASTAAAALIALERARLDGVQLAARTVQHELNNQLAVARGYAEILASSSDLPQHLLPMAQEVMHAADDAARIVRRIRGITHIYEQQWNAPEESTINLERSLK